MSKASKKVTARKAAGKTKKDSYRGIPKKKWLAVGAILGMHRASGIRNATPESVYAEMVYEEERQRNAASEANKAADNGAGDQGGAFGAAMQKLADAHEMVESIEKGSGLTAEAAAMFGRLALHEAGAELEAILLDMGLLELNAPYFMSDHEYDAKRPGGRGARP